MSEPLSRSRPAPPRGSELGCPRWSLAKVVKPGVGGVPSSLERTPVNRYHIRGLEVICASDGFEDFGASVERAHQAGDGSLGDLAQERFQLGIGLFDRVHVGL
jgi:hypothetical protein